MCLIRLPYFSFLQSGDILSNKVMEWGPIKESYTFNLTIINGILKCKAILDCLKQHISLMSIKHWTKHVIF